MKIDSRRAWYLEVPRDRSDFRADTSVPPAKRLNQGQIFMGDLGILPSVTELNALGQG